MAQTNESPVGVSAPNRARTIAQAKERQHGTAAQLAIATIEKRLSGNEHFDADQVALEHATLECYEVAGETYWKITGWQKHQRIDQPTYRHPLPDGSVPTTVRRRSPEPDSTNVRRTNDERSGRERSGEERKGKEEEKEREKTATPKSAAGQAVEIDTWLSSFGDADAIPDTDPIFDYADKAGIPLEFLAMSWKRFVDDMRERKTRKKNWGAHYRNAVRGNWFKLWWFTPEGDCRLTTVGEQERRAAA